jgi:hypothetical protein
MWRVRLWRVAVGASRMSKESRTLQRVHLANRLDRPLVQCVEPWANEYKMPPEARWVLEIEGPAYPNGFVGVEYEAERIVAVGWDGSDYRLVDVDSGLVEDWSGIGFRMSIGAGNQATEPRRL